MIEHATHTRIEDAIDSTNSFMARERGSSIDGSFASIQLQQRIMTATEQAEALLTETPHPNLPGLYVPLNNKMSDQFERALAVLPGHIVLIPSATVDRKGSVFYPAVVSEDSLAFSALRLHVLRQPYQKQLTAGARTILSGAAQAETAGIGHHNRTEVDGMEAEHFTALLTISSSTSMTSKWMAGEHFNHGWRKNTHTSVTGQMHQAIFSDEIPQTTLTISKQDITGGRTAVFWHDSLRGENGTPEHAAKEDALVIVQALGFQALKEKRPEAIDTIKGVIS